MIKFLLKTIFAFFFLILLCVGVVGWFVTSDVGNSVDFIKNQKVQIKTSTENYMTEKKNETIAQILNKLNYSGTNTSSVNVKVAPKTPTPPQVSPVDSKGQPKIDPSSTAEIKTPLKPEIVKSEFNHLSIPFFYDHSNAPKNLTKEQVLALVKESSDTWNEACNISFDYKGDRLSDYVDQDNTINRREGLIKWGQLQGGAIGQAHQGNGRGPATGFVLTLKNSFFDKQENVKYLHPTILHELSHVIGLGHSKNPTSIMYFQQTNRQQTLNETDKVMCKYYRARWQGMSIQQASDKYGVLVNEQTHGEEVETSTEDE